MIKRLFILFLLTSCYSVDRDCENFKMGEFEFTYKLNDTIQRSLFTRTLDYEIEEFNNVIDSSSISWVNDCEFVLTKVNPKTNQEKRPVRIKGTTKPFQLTDKVLKKHPTYFLSVTLKKPRPPKNIYLGNEMKIRNHLSKYYKDDKWLKNTTNWKRELLNTSHKGNDRHDILFDLIQKSPSNFRKMKITLDTLYPL